MDPLKIKVVHLLGIRKDRVVRLVSTVKKIRLVFRKKKLTPKGEEESLAER
jgi:hypothetical protein